MDVRMLYINNINRYLIIYLEIQRQVVRVRM